MKRMRFATGTWATTLSLSAALVIGAGVGSAAADGGSTVDSWAVPSSDAGAVWTPARMKAALPGDQLIDDNVTTSAGSSSAGDSIGKAKLVDGQQAEGARSEQSSAAATPRAIRVSTVDHIGKVFFVIGGVDYECSANVVSAQNENTVATAGHCTYDIRSGFASEFIFVPAYENGRAPLGQWEAVRVFTPRQWTSSEDFSYDTAFLRIASRNGATLSDTVGASGVTFNRPRGLEYSLYGYPAAAPFNGETLQACKGSATRDPFGQTRSQGVSCNMTGGSSGGPWFIGTGASGLQNSVNSFSYDNIANRMFGPYWGTVIEDVYDEASSR